MKYIIDNINFIKKFKNYSFSNFKSDLTAGLTVGVVLIPQSMAYAVIAGLPPIYGLYAGAFPLLVYSIIGNSRHLAIGPVALDMIILAAGLGVLAGGNTEEKVFLAILITVLTGALQIIMSLLKFGFIINLFSRPVISGFTIAAPIIIIFSQFGAILKVDVPNTQYIYSTIEFLAGNIQHLHIPTLLLSVFSIGFLVFIRHLSKKIPGVVILVVLTLCAGIFIDFRNFGIELIDSIPEGLPEFKVPAFDLEKLKNLASTAISLSLIQFMTVASLARSFSRKHNYTVNPNSELFAIGASNFIGGFFQSVPVSASFSRSAVNEQAGSNSSLSNLFAGLLVILTLIFLTSIFEGLPKYLLSAIIVVSVFSLIDVKEIKFLINTKRRDAVVALITFLSVLIIGIQEGIIIGVIASVIAILIKLGKPTVAELGLIPKTRDFKNISRFEEAKQIPGILILRIDASFSFVNAHFFKNYILEKSLGREKETEYVIIDGSTIGDLDISAIDTLIMIIETLEENGIKLYVSGLIGPVRDVIKSTNMDKLIETERFFRTVHDAVESALRKLDNNDKGNRLNDYSESSA